MTHFELTQFARKFGISCLWDQGQYRLVWIDSTDDVNDDTNARFAPNKQMARKVIDKMFVYRWDVYPT